jgi:hypothetical protein|nr:MAG TPA: structural protein [Bacteriophage sp.]
MANFVGNFTKKGLSLLSDVILGTELHIKRAVVGTGRLPEGKTAYDMVQLVEPVDVEAHTTGYENLGEGKCAIRIRIQNSSKDFECREIGIIAEDKDGNEILYQYANAGDKASLIQMDEAGLFFYDIWFITVLNGENDVKVDVDLNVGVLQQDFDEHVNNNNNPHQVTKEQIGLGNVVNAKQATSAELDSLVSQLNSEGILNSLRNVNQLYSVHDFAGNSLYSKVQEAYFVHTLTAEEKTDKYVSLFTILGEIGYTYEMDYNKLAVLMLSARVGEGEGMCVIDSYGKCYEQDSEIHFDSSRAEILYGTIRIVRYA